MLELKEKKETDRLNHEHAEQDMTRDDMRRDEITKNV